jgi:hypothetical protein
VHEVVELLAATASASRRPRPSTGTRDNDYATRVLAVFDDPAAVLLPPEPQDGRNEQDAKPGSTPVTWANQ